MALYRMLYENSFIKLALITCFVWQVQTLYTQDVQYIVAHYNEDLSWLASHANQTHVYHKGVLDFDIAPFTSWSRLPNVGREGHTYLWHIIHNYHNLAEITFFLQGRIADHAHGKTVDDLLPQVRAQGIAFFGDPYHPSYGCMVNRPGYGARVNGYGTFASFCSFWKKIFGQALPKGLVFYQGACFGVKKELIQSRPLAFYERLLPYLYYHICPEEGYHLERMWYFIFDPVAATRP